MAPQIIQAEHDGLQPTSLSTIYTTSPSTVTDDVPTYETLSQWRTHSAMGDSVSIQGLNNTAKGILIGMVSAFGTAALVGIVLAIIYFLKYTSRGRILLDRIARPGEFDDEQAFLREEEDALANMDEMQRTEYLRAKAFVQANPPESLPTDISLSQFLAIQEKGVSAWEFEPELEIANCFVEARTEIEFFDSECSVQSNLPIPKQNEVYYFEAKIYDKADSAQISIGLTTKPYPLFRLPGYHRHSIAYTSSGHRRYNQPFTATPYGPAYVQGDVVGVGYRPRTGTVFFTRNGKKLDDVAHNLKSQNFFPTIGSSAPANIHVNLGQMGFVFIEANVKKWGLAPQTGSLAAPPPYGSEQGSILLESGREGVREGYAAHNRNTSAQLRLARGPSTSSLGPQRSPTDISLAQLTFVDTDDDVGERTDESSQQAEDQPREEYFQHTDNPPPDYESPTDDSTPRASYDGRVSEDRRRLLDGQPSPPIPSYEAATGEQHDSPSMRTE